MEEAGKPQQGEAAMEEAGLDRLGILTVRVKLKKNLPDNKIKVVKEESKPETVKNVKPETESDVPRKVLQKTEKIGSEIPIEVTRQEAGLLLRDGKAYELRRKHGVSIDISGEVADRRRTVVIRGEEGRRARAEEEVRRILASVTSIEVSKGEGSFLICSGQANKLEAKFGVTIDVCGEVKDEMKVVDVRGEEARRTEAEAAIREVLGKNLGEEVVVRKVEALYMLSNKGRVVRGIEGESGAMVEFDTRGSASNFIRVRVQGTREQVEAAKALMARLGRNTLQAPVSGREAEAIIREQLATKVQG